MKRNLHKGHPMLIDKYLQKFDFNEYHEITIQASPVEIFPVIKELDFTKSRLVKLLFTLRGLPKSMRNMKGFIEVGFILLEEKENEEIVLGFLANHRGLKIVTPEEFINFAQAGYVMAAWNFHLVQVDEEKTLISTETRILGTSKKAKFIFSLYWFFIYPFSAFIRKVLLKMIKDEVE